MSCYTEEKEKSRSNGFRITQENLMKTSTTTKTDLVIISCCLKLGLTIE